MQVFGVAPNRLLAKIENRMEVAGLHDKGKATILEVETKSYEKKSGELLCMNRTTVYLRGAGDFSKSSPPYSYVKYPPTRYFHENVLLMFLLLLRATVYLLQLLVNRHNIVFAPNTAWLCTLGFAVRAIIKRLCNGEPTMVKSIFGRFLLHVYPGETLITEMWVEGSSFLLTLVGELVPIFGSSVVYALVRAFRAKNGEDMPHWRWVCGGPTMVVIARKCPSGRGGGCRHFVPRIAASNKGMYYQYMSPGLDDVVKHQ
ncbi:hypothetical protein Sjap_004420 [Stephania japonica]|uniref:Peroxisomal multifunctional enzyme type 2-like N-terminal domain-containing protein n=1 Tax=Stephania japonica TaxID=461633 RepID=A0AAP0PHT9_9MAGN